MTTVRARVATAAQAAAGEQRVGLAVAGAVVGDGGVVAHVDDVRCLLPLPPLPSPSEFKTDDGRATSTLYFIYWSAPQRRAQARDPHGWQLDSAHVPLTHSALMLRLRSLLLSLSLSFSLSLSLLAFQGASKLEPGGQDSDLECEDELRRLPRGLQGGDVREAQAGPGALRERGAQRTINNQRRTTRHQRDHDSGTGATRRGRRDRRIRVTRVAYNSKLDIHRNSSILRSRSRARDSTSFDCACAKKCMHAYGQIKIEL